MTNAYRCLSALILILVLAGFAPAQDSMPRFGGLTLKSGVGFEYMHRTIDWGDDTDSAMKSLLLTISAEFELQDGFSITAIAGYSMANFESLIFREVPLSVDLEVGNIGGIVLGAEVEKSLFFWREFTFFGNGRLLSYLGSDSEWNIPGLNVEGVLNGKPTWMQGQIGPRVVYEGLDDFHPYMYVHYNRLWGTFQLDETILDLKGTEEKDISGKSVICTGLGTTYALTDDFILKAETAVMPYSGGVDWSFVVKFQYSFHF